jgi:hypothetical protein
MAQIWTTCADFEISGSSPGTPTSSPPSVPTSPPAPSPTSSPPGQCGLRRPHRASRRHHQRHHQHPPLQDNVWRSWRSRLDWQHQLLQRNALHAVKPVVVGVLSIELSRSTASSIKSSSILQHTNTVAHCQHYLRSLFAK